MDRRAACGRATGSGGQRAAVGSRQGKNNSGEKVGSGFFHTTGVYCLSAASAEAAGGDIA